MRSAFGRLALVTPLAVCVACASGRPGDRAARGEREDRNVITQQQMLERGYLNAYEAVLALRSNWLRTRGVDSFQSPTPVWVYIDSNRLGGVETLRGIATRTVQFIRFYNGVEAQARWGIGHGQGVILVSTLL